VALVAAPADRLLVCGHSRRPRACGQYTAIGGNAGTNQHADGNAHTNTYSHQHAHADTNCYQHTHADADSYRHTNRHLANTNARANGAAASHTATDDGEGPVSGQNHGVGA
jgi:hypothetical protein